MVNAELVPTDFVEVRMDTVAPLIHHPFSSSSCTGRVRPRIAKLMNLLSPGTTFHRGCAHRPLMSRVRHQRDRHRQGVVTIFALKNLVGLSRGRLGISRRDTDVALSAESGLSETLTASQGGLV